ncbi:RagB/SusD family nutrient uptake outer membrane protein [Sphingobacterium shayense]|uniref:RagB/SusD family nutrient uptake outer membrane protein n=1 Tax=Sphingobacterium shayense TaxID=626343 RepID=UPI001553963E|nr:RagB/SusD family nutrient uptake outer membrane protein [Sphingobacterium shayense]NQD70198.1 RagB/SusD family nutrient uptake outer membrane protein [Sphingobacterium shayense]
MKRVLFNSIIFILSCSMLPSCSEKLEVDLESAITANSMWQDESDAKAAIFGAYTRMREAFSTSYIYWGEYRSGLWGPGLATNAGYSNTFSNQLNSSHAQANWKNLYTTINDCNLILKHVPEIAFTSEEEKNNVLGQAYYIRGFCYYWIARIWGDAPVVLSGFESGSQDDLYPSRQPAADVYAQVEKDLEQAGSLLGESAIGPQVASISAVYILQADYYLWMNKVNNSGPQALGKAKAAIDQLISSNNHALLPNFADVFSSELNPEIIFCWRMVTDEATGGYPSDFLVPLQYISASVVENPVKAGSHQQWIFLTDSYKELLEAEADDQRSRVSFETFFDPGKNDTFQWINKYAGTWENGTRIFNADIVVYRYADALLLGAEIENALGNTSAALGYLNSIAKRAYGVDNKYSALSKTEIDEAVLLERKREFVAEGKLWWDLIRMGVVFEQVESLADQKDKPNILLWPVHDSSINTNPNITQTEGYN